MSKFTLTRIGFGSLTFPWTIIFSGHLFTSSRCSFCWLGHDELVFATGNEVCYTQVAIDRATTRSRNADKPSPSSSRDNTHGNLYSTSSSETFHCLRGIQFCLGFGKKIHLRQGNPALELKHAAPAQTFILWQDVRAKHTSKERQRPNSRLRHIARIQGRKSPRPNLEGVL
jgi:hypothetical protein